MGFTGLSEYLFLVILVSFQVSFSTSSQLVPLTKCCALNESYVIGFDSCQSISNINISSSHILQNYYPPIYSSFSENKILVEDAASRIQLAFNLSTCPDGFVQNVSTEFFLYENGSLSIPQFGIWITHGEFCIDEFETFDPQEPLKAIARFCVPDPCLEANCIRKCCHEGMELYVDGFGIYCRFTEDAIMVTDHFVFRNLSEAAYVIRNGVAPFCPDGIDVLESYGDEIDSFSVLENGSISITNLLEGNQITNDYCVDYKTTVDENQKVMTGIACKDDVVENLKENSWVLKIFPCVLLVSSVFLIATFVVYALVPEMRNLHGLSVMCQVASLAVTYIFLAINQMSLEIHGVPCIIIGTVLHFSFLSAFSWLNVISFYTWWIFRNLRPTTGRNMNNKLPFLFCSFYGWGLPLIIVLVGLVLDITYYDRKYDDLNYHRVVSNDGIIRPDFGAGTCWFATKISMIAYLYGPIGFLILINFVLFILTTIALYQASKDTLAARKREATQKFRVIFSLFILMGISWLAEIISIFVGGDAKIWIAFDIFNILTGVVVFIMFICKPTVWSRLKKRFPCLERLDVSFNKHVSRVRRQLGRHPPASNNPSHSSSTPHSQQTTFSTTSLTIHASNHFQSNNANTPGMARHK